jgi:hypothetical protein
MTLAEECALSFYREIGKLNEAHGVCLVQHVESRKVYVKKVLAIYDANVYRYLKDHPVANTPRICEVVEDGERLIVIEEYINGTSLQEILDREGCLTEERSRDIALQLCAVLGALHATEPPIIHRDIKPSNIILQADGTVKLLDMNAAKWAHSAAERDTRLIGTYGYAAPEQYGFGASGVQTDIYSLGILLNVMLTGDLSRSRLPAGPIGDVIRKCTALDPNDRYRNAGEVAEALAVRVGKRSASARRGKWYVLPGFRTQQPLKMIFGGIGYLAVLLMCAVMTLDGASPANLWLNRLVCGGMFLMMILFSANYMGVWDRVHITNLRSPWLRLVAVILGDFGIFLAWMTALALLEKIVK